MGWWTEIRNESEIVIGDDVLDIFSEAIQNVCSTYNEAFRRMPTIAELDALFERVRDTLPSSASQFVELGQVFSVPLDSALYAFGRVVGLSTEMGPTCEFFAITGASDVPLDDILCSSRLCTFIVSDCALREGAWPVIGVSTQDLPHVQFVVKEPISEDCGMVVENDVVTRQALADEMNTLPEYAIHGSGWVERTLRAQLLRRNTQ